MGEYGRGYANEIRSPDFVKFAQSFGAAGLRVEDPAELPASISRALAMTAESPVILDVVSGHDWPVP